jgi:hypothetical protein
MIAILITTFRPAPVLKKIGFCFSNVVSAMRHSSLRSAEVKVGLPSVREEENCRLDFGAYARAATKVSVMRYFTSPNKALEPTTTAVTPRACARVAPAGVVADLGR